MSRRYDTRTTTFSPEGRLYQVEYAMEAISQAGTCIGILTREGILLAVENRKVHKLLDDSVGAEKIYKLTGNIACSVAGITGDANKLVHLLRLHGQRHLLQYNEEIPVQQMVENIADYKQYFTQRGGKRPFGVSILYMGWDEHFQYQLYMSDPSGNYSGWKSMCIGKNSQAAISLLKQEYKEDITMEDAEKLCIKVLAKTLDFKLSPDKIEVTKLTRANDETVFSKLPLARLTVLIEDYERLERQREEEAAARAAALPR